MAKGEEEKRIDDETYTFYQMGAIKSHGLLLKIVKIVGPAFGEMVDSSDKGGLDALIDADIDMGAIIKGLCDRADETVVLNVILALLSQVTHDSGSGNESGTGNLKSEATVDTHFMGRLPHMYKVVLAAAEVQYGDFFAEGGILDSFKAKAQAGNQKK